VLDPRLALSPGARMLGEPGPVLVITGSEDAARREALIARGAEVLRLPDAAARDLGAVLAELARREVNELLVEAGARLAGAFIAARLVDEFVLYLAPHMLGHDAVPLAMLPMLDELGERWQFRYADVRQVGEDLRLTVVPRGAEGG
jgi:diaminohydroxyphosphoribosylaminopyrimidine deaminase/5-amino-6-(5-phosphoribosylamino)uracil reductase